MEQSHTAWIGLGSNQGDRFDNLQQAIRAFNSHSIYPKAVSRVYETEPLGFTADTSFLNAVAEIQFHGSAAELLTHLQQIEQQLGRVRHAVQRYSSRTIDLDILFFGEEVINTHELVIPHPHITHRRFVLDPLTDLIPSYKHPILQITITQIKENCIDKNPSLIHPKPLSINH